MDRVRAMTAFVRCVERGSFSSVAREMKIAQPTVSKLVASLERHLGGKLFARSTRELALTEEGRRFYERCRVIVDAVDHAEASFKNGREEIAGTLRVATSVSFGRAQLMPRVAAFLRQYPLLRLDVQLNDRFVDLVEEGIDVAFRIGELTESSLIARRIGTTNRVTVAAPKYLEERGEPRHPEDLKKHNCILYTGLATQNEWPYMHGGRSYPVPVSGNFQSNSAEAVRAATLAGIGIALTPVWLFGEDLRRQCLKVLLSDYLPKPLPIHALSPTNRRHSAKVRAFVEFFQAEFDTDPFVSGYRSASI
jgi:DNA-binding transcriptional LysR family regulator